MKEKKLNMRKTFRLRIKKPLNSCVNLYEHPWLKELFHYVIYSYFNKICAFQQLNLFFT